MSNPIHDELIRQAVEAVRAGERDKARDHLEEVLREDEENVKAWLLLARITTNLDEKRMALTTILQLDPYNEKARELLDKLDAQVKLATQEFVPGISKSTFRLLAGGIGGFVLLVLVVVVVIISSSRSQQAERNRVATGLIVTQTQFMVQATAMAAQSSTAVAGLTQTSFLTTSPTPTPSPTRSGPTLPPSFTPEPTQNLARPTPLAAPVGVSGRLITWSGRDLLNADALPIIVRALDGSSPVTVGENLLGRFASAAITGDRIIYTRYDPNNREYRLESIGFDGAGVERLSARWAGAEIITDPDMAQVSRDGRQMVFVARALNTSTSEVYLLNLDAGAAGPALTRLTNDSADYTFPSLSPDGSQIAVIRTLNEGDLTGPDVVVINVSSRTQTALTRDGAATLEMTPNWSPDGRSVIYAAASASNRNNHDLILVSSDGSVSFTLISDPADDIYPVYSPDGRYVAFASNRSQTYDIFIYDTSAQTLFQLTDTVDEDYPGAWIE